MRPDISFKMYPDSYALVYVPMFPTLSHIGVSCFLHLQTGVSCLVRTRATIWGTFLAKVFLPHEACQLKGYIAISINRAKTVCVATKYRTRYLLVDHADLFIGFHKGFVCIFC